MNHLNKIKTSKFFSGSKIIRASSFAFIAAALVVGGFFSPSPALAAATVNPASGGTNISIDTTSAPGGTATFKTLTGPSIGDNGDIAVGTHTINLPAGWEFDTGSQITIAPFNDIGLESTSITPTQTSFSFVVTSQSTVAGFVGFSGLKVRPTGTTPSTGNMTYSGAGIVGVDGSTNFGTLSTVPGTVAQLVFATQPGGAEYGSLLNPQPSVKTQDQFGNDSIKDLVASLEVGLTLTGGTGALVGDATLDIGTGVGNGTVTFADLTVDEFGTSKQLTAAATDLTSAVSDNFEIIKKPLSATITASNKVYDGTADATITGRTLVGVISGDSVTANEDGSATFADINAGTEKTVSATGITITGTDALNYTYDGTAAGTADITPKPITVTAEPKSKTYGEADSALTYTNDPLVGSDVFTGSLSRDAGENVGTYAITQGDLDNSNYGITFVSDDLTINQRSITVTAVTNTKVYDGNITSVATPAITDGSLAFSDTAGFTQTYDNKNVGTGKILTPDGIVNDGNEGANYNVTFVNDETGVITQKGLTVSGLSVADKTYDGNTDAVISGIPSLVGDVESDDVSLIGTAAGEFNTANVGVNTIAISGLSLDGTDALNYTLTQPVLNAEITPLEITVTPDADQSKIYGDADPIFAYTSDPLIGGDVFTGALSRDAGENVGTYAYILGDLSAGANYSLSLIPGTFEITQKTLIVSATGVDKVYDTNTTAEVTLSSDDIVGGDDVTFGYAAIFSDKNVANNKVVSVSEISITGGEDAGNYTLGNTTAETTADITPAPLTATITANDKVYDGNDSVIITAAELDGVLESDVVVADLGAATANFADKNVDNDKTVSALGITIDGVDAGNYSYDGTASGTADITPATLTVSAIGVDKVYDGNTNAEATLSGDTIGDDEVTFGYVANFTDKNVGEDKIVNVLSISINGGDDADNYTLGNTQTDATANVTPVTLTATITADDKVYDGNTSATITGRTLVGVISGDSVTVNEDGTATFDTKDVGTDKIVSAIDITIAGSDAGNYTYDGTAAGTADITPLEIIVTPDADQSKIYGEADPAFTYTFDPVLIGGDEFAGNLSREEGENVGTYDYTLGDLSAGSNYSMTLVPGIFGITQRPITITAVTDTKIYDGTTNSAATPEIADGSLAFSDTAGFTQTYDNKNVGTGKILTPDGIVNDGNEGANYNVTFVNDETGVITEKELTVSGLSAVNKTYDGTTAADVSGTPALVGIEGTDDVSLTGVAEGEFNTANVGTVQVEIISLSLTGGDASNYTLTQPVLEAEILQLEITGSFTTENKVYDGNTTAAVLTQSLDGVLPVDEGNVVLTGGAADFADPNVANGITVTASGMTLGGSAAGNYTLASVDTTTADITQLEIVVTPDAGQSKVYGQDDPSFAYTNTPALIGEDAFSGALSRAAGENVGTYEYELDSLTAGGNYSLTLETETFEIVKAAPVITWENPADIVYGAALSGTELNATADVDGTFAYTPVSGIVLNAGGEQELSVTFTPTDTGNYSVVEQTVVINVNPAPLTVTADDKSKDYGESDPVLTYSYDGLVNGDTEAVFNGALVRDSGEDVGEYGINQGTVSAGTNYAIAYESGTFTIEDTVDPTLLSHTPSVNAVNVAVGSSITITFSESVNIAEGAITLNPGTSFTMSGDGTNVITLTPTSAWDDNTIYTVTVTEGVEDVNGNALTNPTSWSFTTATSYNVNLNADAGGWNLISLPVVPTNKNISAVLSGVESSIEAVWTYDPSNPNAVDGWLVYTGNPATSNLDTMTSGYGYWINAISDATISGSGSLIVAGPTTPPSRNLSAGWNLVGYYQIPGENESDANEAFASIGGTAGMTGLWGFNNTTGAFTSVSTILPGDAFWVSLPSAKTYTPSNL